MDVNEISRLVIGAAIEVHDAFGPGLYEKVYLGAMVVALADRGLECRTQVPVQVRFKGRPLGRAYLIDGVVQGCLAVEVKVVEALLPVHVAQAITYVRLAHLPAGLLINFNCKRLVDGVRRIVNDRPTARPSVTSGLVLGGEEKGS